MGPIKPRPDPAGPAVSPTPPPPGSEEVDCHRRTGKQGQVKLLAGLTPDDHPSDDQDPGASLHSGPSGTEGRTRGSDARRVSGVSLSTPLSRPVPPPTRHGTSHRGDFQYRPLTPSEVPDRCHVEGHRPDPKVGDEGDSGPRPDECTPTSVIRPDPDAPSAPPRDVGGRGDGASTGNESLAGPPDRPGRGS